MLKIISWDIMGFLRQGKIATRNGKLEKYPENEWLEYYLVSSCEGLYSGAMLVAGEGIPRHIPPPFIALHLSSPASSIFALRLTLQFRGRPVGQIGDRVGLTTAGRTIS